MNLNAVKQTWGVKVSKQRVLILGGGFAGVRAALLLSDSGLFDITLISDQHDFKYYPALYRSATGGARMLSVIPLKSIFNEHGNVKIVHATATKLDRAKKTVLAGDKHYGYDKLIVSLGVVTNYFGIKGLEKYSYGIKSIEEADEFKHHLHDQMINDHRPDLNYVIVGAGPTGIELAGALPAYLKRIMNQHKLPKRAIHISLIEAAPRVIPRMPKDVSRAFKRRLRSLGIKVYTNQKVEAETADSLIVNDKPIQSHTVVWTAGVTNNPFLKDNHFELNSHGKATVNQYLQSELDIYVLGDNADTKYSGMAQTALYDASYVSSNLINLASSKKIHAYKPKKPIYVTPCGNNWASVLWGNVRINGWLGWMLRRVADLRAYHDYRPWWPASQIWMAEYTEQEECLVCNTNE